ncbi:VOC family protein [Pelagovum pacificum]|uniref:VOC family protein n=1 Tax=Pelagovum pacificum TaxID=2588711 RepID=A0A5C5G8X7_9RHOB|nr:VOC family protein [Pelagovum pacificum]QQA42077.1 VOC family protein [Pelagovum pacificum]TNY31165.1 VOC family protein [Pelagovum pacificum]
MFKGINVVSIPVPDLAAARTFYSETLGLGEPLFDLPDDGWIEFSTGAPGSNLSITTAPDGWQPSDDTVCIVLNVEDTAAAVQDLTSRGITCSEAATVEGMVTFASFHDPFGNKLQICSAA